MAKHLVYLGFYKMDEICDGFIGVHVGAGNHCESKEKLYRRVCDAACLAAVTALKSNCNAEEAATKALIVLEDNTVTNAGIGSNLTEDGTIEMDAGIMEGGYGMFGGVGAVEDVRNPSLISQKLIQRQKQGVTSYGRIPPSVLVGEGAKMFAMEQGIPTTNRNLLITEERRKQYQKYKNKVRSLAKSELHDTVGVVCMDKSGHIASGCSSGGIALKHRGRLGQAAMFGCGTWASDANKTSAGVAVSTTGCGEQLIRTMLAQKIASALQKSSESDALSSVKSLEDILTYDFLRNITLKGTGVGRAGCIAFKYGLDQQFEFLYGHTTESLIFGYMTTNCDKATSKVSRLPEGYLAGATATVQSIPIHINSKQQDNEENFQYVTYIPGNTVTIQFQSEELP